MKMRPLADEEEYRRLLDFVVEEERSLDLGYVLPPPVEVLKRLFPAGHSWLAVESGRVVGAVTVLSWVKLRAACLVRLLADGEQRLQVLYDRVLRVAKTRQYRWTRVGAFGYQKEYRSLLEGLGFAVGVTLPRGVYLDGSFYDYLLLFHDLANIYNPPRRPYLGREPLYPVEEETEKGEAQRTLRVKFRLAQEEDAEAYAETVSSIRVFKFMGMGQYEGHMTLEKARERIRRAANDRDVDLIVAEDLVEGRAVGFAGLSVHRRDVMRHVGGVGMWVAPKWQGRGLGTQLIQEAGRLAKRKHLLKLFLSVFAFNEPAQHLYRKTGFRPCGELPGYLVDDYTQELYMYKDLS